MRRKLNEFANTSRALHTIVILGFVIAFMVSILSCQDFYIGKTEAELSQEMIYAHLARHIPRPLHQ